jgi:hypothetical protein
MIARALAVCHTCVFDAWAAYDRVAVGTRLGGELRRPPRERTLANKSKAISFASRTPRSLLLAHFLSPHSWLSCSR